ncbi:MAG TPA: hypothetical protein PKJ83_17020, partial [Cyclobacteriaceae bacterium]|nr:hypothetical protein [Cyclobacteriaceae bacterium]
MKTTFQSDYGKLKSVFIKRPKEAFVDESQIASQWKDLNFLSKPDLTKAEVEYAAFEKMITQQGAVTLTLPFDSSVTMDSIYCRDAAIATDYGMILCNMGKPARK